MDPALSRFVEDPACQLPQADGGFVPCVKDQRAFRGLVNQYGAAIAPTGFMPAKSTGYGGFELLYEGSFTTVDSKSKALRLGTRGQFDKESDTLSSENASPKSFLQLHSLRVRKGLGLGFEASAQVGLLAHTSIMVAGADLRLSLLEGFRVGRRKYLPDFAIAGSGRGIAGATDLRLAAFDLRATLSKVFTLRGASLLTPVVGYQYLWIRGSSRLIDFTPTTNAFEECQYSGANQPGSSERSDQANDGSPVCGASGSDEDFNNIDRFSVERLTRQRLFLGLQYRYEYLLTGAQVLVDVVPPSQQNNGLLDGALSQWGIVVHLGAGF